MGDPPGDASHPVLRDHKVWVLGSLFAAAVGLILVAIHWAGSGEQPEFSVARQWNEAIQKLGFEPVYPPIEDIEVGDVFAMITDDMASDSVSAEPFAGRSIKLMHLDLTQEIEDSYRELYQFPGTLPQPVHEGEMWPQSSSTDSLFKPPATRTTLPLVLFPRFTVTSMKHASGNAGALFRLWGAAFGAEASSSETVEVRFSATETYGVPAVPAELRLVDFCDASATKPFCSDKGLRKQLSVLIGTKIDDKVKDRKTGAERPRFSVELALVSRVFLARSIKTTIGEGSSTQGNGGLTQGALSAVPAQPVQAAAVDASDGHAQQDVKSQPALPAPQAGANNAPGAAIGFDRRTTSDVLLPDTLLPRPVVVGFKSVRFQPVE